MKMLSFQYDTEKIEFAVVKSKRKSISIAIQPDGNLLVKAPLFMFESEILKWVKTKTGWIIRQRAKVLEQQSLNPPKQFVTGERFLYLGKEYELKWWESLMTGLYFLQNQVKKPKYRKS